MIVPLAYAVAVAAERQEPGARGEPEHPVWQWEAVLSGHGAGDVALEVVEHVPPPHLSEVVSRVSAVFEQLSVVGHGVVDVPQPGCDPVGHHHVDRVVAAGKHQKQDAGEGKAEGGVVQQKPTLRRVCKKNPFIYLRLLKDSQHFINSNF